MPTNRPIVLYVEDEECDRFLMERAFAKAGLQDSLRMVDNGLNAMAYLSGRGEYADREYFPLPAIVLLDLHLPEVNGFEVLEWIRKQPAHNHLPVVVFSSSERQEDRALAAKLGATDFLKKPGSGLGFTEVVRIVQRALDPGNS